MYRVNTIWSGAPVQGGGITRLHYNETGGSAQEAATATATLWEGIESTINATALWRVDADVEVVNEATGQVTGIESTTGADGAGTNANELLPQATQLLVRLRSGVFIGGREVRGRFFIPGQVESNNLSGGPSSTMCDLVQGILNGWVDDVATQPVIWSRTKSQIQVVSSALVWRDEWAVLRSRRD